jgi:hypothetical protein
MDGFHLGAIIILTPVATGIEAKNPGDLPEPAGCYQFHTVAYDEHPACRWASQTRRLFRAVLRIPDAFCRTGRRPRAAKAARSWAAAPF